MKRILSLGLLFCGYFSQAQNFKNPAELFDPTPYGFNHSVSVPLQGELIFISGQSGGQGKSHILSSDFRTQVQVALKNLVIVLDSHGLKPQNTTKITILIVDHSPEKLKIWSEEMNKVWEPKNFPASTLIPVPRLAIDGMQIEVDAIAYKKSK
ncbi:RidA family protein [Flavobacterium sp. '19STA2R22 D10 B1']|uniref:RidA family protein n=1 Tax=Flavobacterium aerium TaxID=3037261 RepID=UPI00278C16EC|nr:RidA family protein [Flavobacterium sp. '19STA2R22 D10 B1']